MPSNTDQSPEPREQYDVVVVGGGLAGLCLALQIERSRPEARILVAEKKCHPLPEAAHKVGESSVEVASHYFTHVLGLGEVLEQELLKFGLRFFMTQGANRDLARRLEFGPGSLLPVPSFQIDRGQFENRLAQQARSVGIDFVDDCQVKTAQLGGADEQHVLSFARSQGRFDVRCRWVVDASGRAAFLKKKLNLARPNRHNVNALWFRVDANIDVDTWSSDVEWSKRVEGPRRLSTNHLMGRGYWVWLIPLARGRTSVGIVTDARLHPFSELHTFEQALAWLEVHEPQFAAVVSAHAEARMDFRVQKNFSHDVKRMFSGDRWCLTGDAGLFLDPLYSPGSDFIGITNGFACDLIVRDLRGQDVRGIAETHNQAFFALARNTLVSFHGQYSLMGSAHVMCTKIVWDFAIYWGGLALLFFGDKLSDAEFMDEARSPLQGFAKANASVQALFRKWDAATLDDEPREGVFLDYAKLEFLADMNRDLLRERDDAALLVQLKRNLQLAQELEQEIIAEAARSAPELATGREKPSSTHLKEMFAALEPAQSFT
ncbi:MAG: flavin-dependent dehydrogenase [Planctomycetota bacterium]|jgi:flavin-dependent dehydrogenase